MIKNLGLSQTLKMNELCNKLAKNNKKIYKYGFGQSPFNPPKFFKDNIVNNINKKEYLSVQGLDSLRLSIACHYNKYHKTDINEDNVVIGPGSKELLCLLNLCINEDIYYVAPYWVSYVNQMKIFNKDFKVTKTTFENKWKITPDQIKKHTDNSFLLLNFPNNPTGLTYSVDELSDIVKVCKDKNITIISDEIYQYLIFNNQTTTLLELYPNNTIVSNGLSKWCHSGGYRLGYMIFPDSYNDLMNTVVSCASETYSCVNTPLQYGAVTIFNNFDKMIEYNLDIIECLKMYNEYFHSQFMKMNIKVHKAEGAFYMFLDFDNYSDKFIKNNILNDNAMCEKLLNDLGIALLPGNAFGIDQGYTCRFSFTNFFGVNSEINNDDINSMKLLNEWLNNL